MDKGSDCKRKRSKKDDQAGMVMTDGTDMISQLPEHIVHHILSFLPIKDVGRSSVLSKTWHGFWTSVPVFDFCQPLPQHYIGARKIEEEFARFVHDSVLAQHHLKRRIQRFRLSMTYGFYPDTNRCINHSLQLVVQHGVKELDINFDVQHVLPPPIVSAKALTVLRLGGCKLELPHPTINWPLLRELSLHKVIICEQIIQNLNLICPLLEKFSLVNSSKLERIRLSGFTKLKKVKVKFVAPDTDQHVKIMEIDVPGLQALNYKGGHPQFQIDMAACTNLQVLKLKSPTIKVQVCQDIISKLHDLKTLVLHCDLLKKINISSGKLGKLDLSSHNLLEAAIQAPRLHSFKYDFQGIGFPALVDTSSLQTVAIKLFNCHLNQYSFLELRKYLLNFNQIKLLTLHIKSNSVTFGNSYYSPHPVPALPVTKHLKLKIYSLSAMYGYQASAEKNYEALVDGLLWTCHPETVLLKSGWDSNNEFMKFLCKKLMHRETKSRCCRYSSYKCWQHDLKGVTIEHYKWDGVKNILTCVDLLESLQSLAPYEKIIFIFDWRSYICATSVIQY